MDLSPAGVHDTEDDDPIRLLTVLDDLMPKMILADVRGASFGGMTDFRELLNEVKASSSIWS